MAASVRCQYYTDQLPPRPFMKRLASLFLFGLIGSIAILVAHALIARSRSVCPASISFVGYSKTLTSSVALFGVTNRSAAAFCVSVRPCSSGGSEDNMGAFQPRALPACGAVEVSVPLPSDTSLWRFNVQLDELGANRNWKDKLRLAFRRVGIHSIRISNGKSYELVTPVLPELRFERETGRANRVDWIQPFSTE